MTELKAIAQALAELNVMLQRRELLMDKFVKGLNEQMPYVGFQPSIANSVFQFLAANTEETIPLISGTRAIRFGYSAAPLYVSVQGRAQIPAARVGDFEAPRGLIINPEGWYYTGGGLQQVSAIAPANIVLTIHCFVQL